VDRNAVFDHIDAQVDQHIANLQAFVRQPSISQTGEGIGECAAMLARILSDLGCQKSEIVSTPGHPVVFATLDAGQPRTLIIYSMYDVQPADEPDWSVPPFEGRLVERAPFGRCLMARGARNTKGPLRSFLNVVEAITAVHDRTPVNLIFVIEGEEEQGSRHLPGFIADHQTALGKADAMYFPHAVQSSNGAGKILLGSKGLLYLELECSGELWGRGPQESAIHSALKPIVDSPAWRMVHALSTLTSVDGNRIAIPGFYDQVRPPSAVDEGLLEAMLPGFEPDVGYGLHRFADDLDGLALARQFLFAPSLNIDGIWGGYTGPGSKTVTPHRVRAKLDFRLVPNLDVQQTLGLLRRHLDRHGYADIQITVLGRAEWSKCSVNESLPQAAIRAYRSLGVEPEVWPMNPGTAPFFLFNRPPLNLPFCVAGLGHSARPHAPDEFLVIEGNDRVCGLAGLEKSFAAVLYEFAESSGAGSADTGTSP